MSSTTLEITDLDHLPINRQFRITSFIKYHGSCGDYYIIQCYSRRDDIKNIVIKPGNIIYDRLESNTDLKPLKFTCVRTEIGESCITSGKYGKWIPLRSHEASDDEE